jgi:hypothetical protein
MRAFNHVCRPPQARQLAMDALAPGPDGPAPPDRGRYSPSFAVAASAGPPMLTGMPGPGRDLDALQRTCAGGLGLSQPAPGRPPRPAGAAGGGAGFGAAGARAGGPAEAEHRRAGQSPNRADLAGLGGRRPASPRNRSPSPYKVSGSGQYNF